MRNWIATLVIAVIASLVTAGVMTGRRHGAAHADTVCVVTESHDTIVMIDTVVVIKPRLVTQYVTDTVRVPADTVLVRETKVYGDSLYHAVVSGIDATLDSLSVFPRTYIYHDSTVVTKTVTFQYKRKRWGVGVSAGYGITPRGLQPYVGLGINYNIH